MAHAHRELTRCAAAAAILGAAMICGCASTPGPAPAGGPAHAPAAAAPQPPAAFYDWRGLIPAPFGTLLKDMPIALTEVLVFHDPAAAGEHGNDDGDCYTTQGISPPPFLGRRRDGYLLCFEHDHLSRIQASVSIPASDAPTLFAAACRQWQRGPGGAADSEPSCTGRDGTTNFDARLGAGEPPQAADAAAMVLTLTLHDHPPQ
jgi:hypothetical protein